jgi:ATP-dependent DNA helicase RecQ
VDFRRDPRATREPTKKKKRTAIALEKPDDVKLFEALRALRLKLARKQGVPPYVVFSDRSLIEMAVVKPRNRAELETIHGVGATKLARYGEAFLAIIGSHAD